MITYNDYEELKCIISESNREKFDGIHFLNGSGIYFIPDSRMDKVLKNITGYELRVLRDTSIMSSSEEIVEFISILQKLVNAGVFNAPIYNSCGTNIYNPAQINMPWIPPYMKNPSCNEQSCDTSNDDEHDNTTDTFSARNPWTADEQLKALNKINNLNNTGAGEPKIPGNTNNLYYTGKSPTITDPFAKYIKSDCDDKAEHCNECNCDDKAEYCNECNCNECESSNPVDSITSEDLLSLFGEMVRIVSEDSKETNNEENETDKKDESKSIIETIIDSSTSSTKENNTEN